MASIRPASPVMIRSARRNIDSNDEAVGLGPARPAVPLAARRADPLQLVVGEEPSHRPAHLVGVRDYHAADFPPAVGVRRKLHGALLELRPRTARARRLLARPLDWHRP